MNTERDTALLTDPDWLREEWHRVTTRTGWPVRVSWHSEAAETCVDAFAHHGHVRPACLALARDRTAAEIPLEVALSELDALFLCATGTGAPGPVVQSYLTARSRATAPGTLPPCTDPITEYPSAAVLQQRLRERLRSGEHTRLAVLRLEVPESRFWFSLRHLLLTARHMERALDEEVFAVPTGQLIALVDAEHPELPERMDRLCRAPVDPLSGPAGAPGLVPVVPRSQVRLTVDPRTGRVL
jgi:hypothetical protein